MVSVRKNLLLQELPYFFGYKTVFFFLPKQSQKSRSVLQDKSRSLGLYRKGKTYIIAKFHGTDLVICSHSTERKTLCYSQINIVFKECGYPIYSAIRQDFLSQ